jgi:DNA-binding SARP family transcriptional activator
MGDLQQTTTGIERSREAIAGPPPDVAIAAPKLVLLRAHLVGPIQVRTYLGDNATPRGRKARAILAYLCLARGDWVPRARLAALLWDSVPEAQARASLRQALREIALVAGEAGREVLTIEKERVRLDVDACWVDALALVSAHRQPPVEESDTRLFLCSGRLLEDLDGLTPDFDHWLVAERSRLADALRSMLDAELERIVKTAQATEQVAAAKKILAIDPTHERASCALMRALVEVGDRAQAIREYIRLAESLKLTLDIAPSRETKALRDAIRALPEFGQTTCAKPMAEAAASPAASLETSEASTARSEGRLRVAVAPFISMDRTVGAHLPLALSHEVAAALARFRWFDVISPVSLVGVRDDNADWPRIFRKLAVDYVLDGALSTEGDQSVLSVKLLDMTHDARPVWSDSVAAPASSIVSLPNLVVGPIVARIDPAILFIEGKHPASRSLSPSTSLLLAAIPLMYTLEKESYERAGQLLQEAFEKEPDNAMVPAWCAFWWMFRMGQGWTGTRDEALERAEKMCLRAMRLDPANAHAIGVFAHLCSFYHHDFESAIHYFDLSLKLNPNLAFVWALSAPTFCYVGEPDRALERMERYKMLAPFDPYFGLFETIYTTIFLLKHEYEKAVSVGRRSVRANPEFVNGYKPLISALGHLGRRQDAERYLRALLAREPDFSIESFVRSYPMKREEDRDHYLVGLRQAGAPETSII